MLLITSEQLDDRRRIAAGPLAPLAASLRAELAPHLARDVYFPRDKALLSREGSRCSRDGTTLEFDPLLPHEHHCPACGLVHRGEFYDRWWIYPYQLWLAERAVHGALLAALGDDQPAARFARDVIEQYADAYLTYPNRDNVLGPTRLFFSTYLESIWLLNICIAADLLTLAGEPGIADLARDRIIEPSARIIAEYDEGHSNRQVWNNAALMAAALTLGDRAAAAHIVNAPSGVIAHLTRGLGADGAWYEGENYHVFAHRGLWYGIALAERAGIAIPDGLLARFHDGFAAPFATALPDLTLPSRKDSPYAVSLRQWRFAELCELGLARGDDGRLVDALAQLYADDIPRRDTGRSRSSADAERNVPPSRLSRSDLGWRSLLCARAELPPLVRGGTRSVHLHAQGVTVFRRDAGSVYVALDWGQSGGGHGHPDRLNLTFSHGATRWLDDLGTGSYVDPSLHWYRSSLAHNAPFVNGVSQRPVAGRVLAYDERGGVGWILARVDELAPGVAAERAVVVTPDYFVDELTWDANAGARVELPVHFAGSAQSIAFDATTLDGGAGVEDGFGFVRDATRARIGDAPVIALSAHRGEHAARAWLALPSGAALFHARAPGQPAHELREFHLVRSELREGALRAVWAWSGRVTDVAFVGDAIHVTLGAERHVHRRTREYWQIEMSVGSAKSGIELYGWTPPAPSLGPSADDVPRPGDSPIPITLHRGSDAVTLQLGEAHYRRSEESWRDAGRPSAAVMLSASAAVLHIRAHIETPHIVFVAADAVNPYDNEHPDINGHGVQIHVRASGNSGAWILTPVDTQHTPRVRAIGALRGLELARAEWQRDASGFTITCDVVLPASCGRGDCQLGVDVLINDAAPGRTRRRGQLVLSGARGEFVYLRGDRHDDSRLLPVTITGQP